MSNTDVVCVSSKQPESKYDFFTKILQIIQSPKPVVSIIKLQGVIGSGASFGKSAGMSLDTLNDHIEKAFKPKKLAAVCLALNSPGGSPVQSELIAARIRSLASEKNIPVYSFVEDVGASGGYWLACAGDYIYASKSSIIGSIGVISASFGLQEAIGKLGIQRRVYTSGKSKSILDPFMPEKQEDVEIIRKVQKQIHEHFINYVKSRRYGKLTQSDDILFNGQFWTGDTALDFGLIDGIDNIFNFIKINFPEANIKYFGQKESWFKKKFGMQSHFMHATDEVIDQVIAKVKDRLNYSKFDLF